MYITKIQIIIFSYVFIKLLEIEFFELCLYLCLYLFICVFDYSYLCNCPARFSDVEHSPSTKEGGKGGEGEDEHVEPHTHPRLLLHWTHGSSGGGSGGGIDGDPQER